MRYGILGTGGVGRTLAAKLESLGHEVRTGGRGAYADVAAHGEVVINATPGGVTLDVLREAGAGALAGKVLIDVSNPLDFSGGFPPTLTVANTDSVGEQIQREFPDAKVVKGFNTVTAELMVAPQKVPGDHVLFTCGDDDAKRQFVATAGEFGWPAERIVDVGGIDAARGLEMYLPLWVRLYQALGDPLFNVALMKA
jgi:8-hydroxy-5-deazaflavin:NADPH oxidoreductase